MLLFPTLALGQGDVRTINTDIRLKNISYLTNNLDSLSRSFVKRGFSITLGSRDPITPFMNEIILPNGTSIHLESRQRLDKPQPPHTLNSTEISSMTFETDNLDSIMKFCNSAGFYCHSFFKGDSLVEVCIDSLSPSMVVFVRKAAFNTDTTIHHPKGIFRIDWVLLSASPDVEQKLRILFGMLSIQKYHEGCCDYWRFGDGYDFTKIRFERAKIQQLIGSDKLTIEEGNIYYAY